MYPDGERANLGFFLEEKDLKEGGARLEKTNKPSALASDSSLATGEIPRLAEYEKGMPPNTHLRIIDQKMVHDELILDDHGLVINLKDKGLIVISGCAHAGIINTVRYAHELTGIDRVHAVVGGFHLTGDYFAPIIDQTITDMKEIGPPQRREKRTAQRTVR